jgi:hypothetical protein
MRRTAFDPRFFVSQLASYRTSRNSKVKKEVPAYCKITSDDDARAMLATNYHWLTEGFDTADLKEAKSLLEEMIH